MESLRFSKHREIPSRWVVGSQKEPGAVTPTSLFRTCCTTQRGRRRPQRGYRIFIYSHFAECEICPFHTTFES